MIRRVAVAAAVLVLVATAVTVVWAHGTLWRPLDNPDRVVVVAENTPGLEVLEQLHAAGLLPSVMTGRLYLRFLSDGRHLHFGRYRVAAGSRPVDVLERLLEGRVETFSITIVEGSTAAEVAAVFIEAGLGDEEAWRRIISRVDWIDDLAPDAPSLEGFLFPDTYRFAVGLGAEAAARHMVDRFRSVWLEATTRHPEPWGSVLELVTLASMVEAETSTGAERPRVAGVFTNRLRRGMLLQCDPTVVYALKRRGEWTGRLLRRHWQTDDPYNTYRYPGLPPGPINSPGQAALVAALEPDSHDELYFVASPDGGHHFSKTLREHERAVDRWLSSRR
jgi:UPF0755 protein